MGPLVRSLLGSHTVPAAGPHVRSLMGSNRRRDILGQCAKDVIDIINMIGKINIGVTGVLIDKLYEQLEALSHRLQQLEALSHRL